MKYITIIKKHGIKLSHLADKMKMSESLLRFHTNKPAADMNKNVKVCLEQALLELGTRIETDLETYSAAIKNEEIKAAQN